MTESAVGTSAIDGCVFHDWATKAELGPYMPRGWRELLVDRPEITSKLRASSLYSNPLGNKDPRAFPEHGPAGSDPKVLIEQLLADGRRERIVLGYDDAILSTAIPPYVARTVVQAANDWTVEKWLSQDARLYGLILIANELPDEAAAEIRRVGKDDRMVGIAMGANGMGKPFGHPVYHPIYRAASELGLPIVIQVGSDTAASLTTWPVAGGLPATFGEYRALGAHALMSHVASMIVEAVFEIFPDLRVLLVGGGATWVPGYVWRLNYWYKLNEHEAPWVKRLPSEYFRDHIRVSTYSLETAREPERIGRALRTVPWFDSTLVYASGYPSVDWEEPGSIMTRLPADWTDKVLRSNALGLFRWPGTARDAQPGLDRRELLERV
jgi:predicted TIM-barrel fold metal-dependent hydrolase